MLLCLGAALWLMAPFPALAQEPPRPCSSRPGQGPEMVLIQPGRFLMGSPESEPERRADEGPRHGVTLPQPFAIGRCEVRVVEFHAFVDETDYRTEAERPGADGRARGCWIWEEDKQQAKLGSQYNWRHPGFSQSEEDPVVCVSWNDAQAYAHWISLRTGRRYRLPTEAEWEYAARAGTTTPFWSGDCIHTDQANYNGRYDYNGCGAKTGLYRKQTLPVGSLPANPWGLYEVAGNVWEWLADCWHEDYQGAPVDGRAWGESEGGHCTWRVVRGGGWDGDPGGLRSANRNGTITDGANDYLGFRLARDL